jgi:hypothetical protein
VRGRRGAEAGHAVGVELGDQVAEGAQGVVVFVEGGFRVAGGGFGGVAVELGLGQKVGAGAFDDFEGAGFEAGGDGGDAQADVVVAGSDLEAGVAELGDFVGAGGVGEPADVFGDELGVVAQGLLALVVFAEKPEDVVAIDEAPDSGEGVAETEVEAADKPAGRRGEG